MNRHLAIKMSCFCVLELRNSPSITRIPRLESEHFNHNLFDPDLIRGSLGVNTVISADNKNNQSKQPGKIVGVSHAKK